MRLTRMGIALLFGMGLLFAGAASAQVVDDSFEVVDSDEPGTTADIDASGDEYEIEVEAICTSGSDEVIISVDSNHPDSVKINKNKATIKQGRSGNDADVNIEADGAAIFDIDLSCSKKASVDGSVSTKKSPNQGKFKAQLKDCTGLSAVQGIFVAATCSGKKTVKIKFDDSIDTFKSIKINGKGEATIP